MLAHLDASMKEEGQMVSSQSKISCVERVVVREGVEEEWGGAKPDMLGLAGTRNWD
jgi:hypothetical protein